MAGWGPRAFANARPVPPLTLGSPAARPGGLSPWVQVAAPAPCPHASLVPLAGAQLTVECRAPALAVRSCATHNVAWSLRPRTGGPCEPGWPAWPAFSAPVSSSGPQGRTAGTLKASGPQTAPGQAASKATPASK